MLKCGSSVIMVGSGSAGDIEIVADDLEVDATSRILTNTEGAGAGGNISIEARTILINGEISSRSVGPEPVLLPDAVMYDALSASVIEVDIDFGEDSALRATGDAGNISIVAPDHGRIEIGGEVITDTNGDGAGGSITISAGEVLIVDVHDEASDTTRSGHISSSTSAAGDAGSIAIDIGDDGRLVVAGGISSAASASGDTGSIMVDGGDVFVTGDLSTSTYGSGENAGSVSIDAREIRLSAGAVYSDAINEGYGDASSGDAGSVSISATESLYTARYTQVTSETSANGDAGSITLRSPLIEIDVRVSTSAGNFGYGGKGGLVTIDAGAGRLTIAANARITSQTQGDGNAGRIELNAARLEIAGNIASTALVGSTYNYIDGAGGYIDANGTTSQICPEPLKSSRRSGRVTPAASRQLPAN